MAEDPASFQRLAETCECIKATPRKLEKVGILAEYFRQLSPESVPVVCRWFAGHLFPAGSPAEAQVGWSTLVAVLHQLTGADAQQFEAAYLSHGDLGEVAEQLWQDNRTQALVTAPLELREVQHVFERMSRVSGARSSLIRKDLAKGLFLRASALEAKYLIKILTGELRIGLVEGLVEEAVAQATHHQLAEVRQTRLIVGDIGVAAELAMKNQLTAATPTLFRPTGFMLADTMQTAQEIAAYYHRPVLAEFKYDGIRAQAHKQGSEVRIFSRRMEDVGWSFPEVVAALQDVPHDCILDGEVLPFKDGRPLAFQDLQHRLRRKTPDPELLRKVPLAYIAFDVLVFDHVSQLNRPLRERRALLEGMALRPPLLPSVMYRVNDAAAITRAFEEAKERGYEGLVIKDPESSYTPGRRGKHWIKLKRELDTLDVVIVAAEYGHGKRAGVLSDYTFAVRENGALRVVGKAYSGVTDDEIAMMTERLKEITTKDQGYRRLVRPEIVLEVAFDNIQRSNRHDSGYALRFPRIKRIRTDKTPAEIDSLAHVEEIYHRQKLRSVLSGDTVR